MTQDERRVFLINYLLHEDLRYRHIEIPEDPHEQKQLLRALVNVRPPRPASQAFYDVEEAYLQEELRHRQLTGIQDLVPRENHIYLWRGDITTLQVDAIVNAANSQMTGCYIPGHSCIDNIIHTNAGIKLRLACQELMDAQGYEEPVGQAKITAAYQLPSRYVIHTVGPMIQYEVTERDVHLLKSCYESCLEMAYAQGLKSLAFCCISTGVFHFPQDLAAQIAVDTVRAFVKTHDMDVIFNVFKPEDERIYEALLS